MSITDLTVEGTFVLGAGIFAHLLVLGHSSATAIILALAASATAGLLVAIIQRITKLDSLITSILAVFMLSSINFKAMGQPNISLLLKPTLMQQILNMPTEYMVLILISLLIIMLTCIYIIMKSPLGLLLRAYGDNKNLLQNLALPKFSILCCGLMLSNSLAAISGILSAQLNGYADIHMGLGVALTAIGSISVGLNLSRLFLKNSGKYRAYIDLCSCLSGVFIYFLVMNLLLACNVDPIYIKLALGVLLMFFLSTHYLKKRKQ